MCIFFVLFCPTVCRRFVYLVYDFHNNNNFDFFNIGLTVNDIVNCTNGEITPRTILKSKLII